MSPEKSGPAAVIVLAAGAGTRMKSRTPKILHEIGGRSMVGHALLAARSINPQRLALVVRHERDRVAAHLTELDPGALIVDQDDVPGTGRAVEVALEALDADAPVAPLTPALRRVLLDGPDFPRETLWDIPSHDALRRLWAAHQTELLAEARARRRRAWFVDRDAFVRVVRGER